MKRINAQALWLFCLFILVGCKILPLSPTATNQQPTLKVVPPTKLVATDDQTPLSTQNLSGLPSFDTLDNGWNQIDPGGQTSCARGGKYSFFVRKTTSSKLLVYFEGGGSCYDANTCREGGNYFDDSIDTGFEADNPALKSHGLFAFHDTRNPFIDYNIVFVNYCTGDAYLGNKTVSYKYGNNTFEVNHMGFVNTQTVFEWIYRNIPEPDSIYMVGCSAGVIGSFFNLPYFKQHYLATPTTIVGDSGGGYLEGPSSVAKSFGTFDLVPSWLPEYQNLISGDILRPKFFFTIPALAYLDTRIGLVDSQEDGVQAEIVSRFDRSVTLKGVLESNMADLRSIAPGINSFIGPGDIHCITMNDNYYNYQANGVQLRDWMTDLASSQP